MRRFMQLGLLAILISAIYIPNLQNSLSYMDDDVLIRNNIEHFSKWQQALSFFTKDVFLDNSSAYYRPIQALSYLIDYQLFGEHYNWYFMTSALLHLLCAFAFFWCIHLLIESKVIAFLFACLFAIHPLQVHAVSWLPGRGDLLLALFSFSALGSMEKFAQQRKKRWLIAGFLALGFALFCKESAVMLMPFLIFWLFFRLRQSGSRDMRLIVLIAFGFAAIFAVYLVARLQAVDFSKAQNGFSLVNVFSNAQTIFELIGKLILPFGLSPLPRHDLLHLSTGIATCCLTLIFLHRLKLLSDIGCWAGMLWYLLMSVTALTFTHSLSEHSYRYLEHRVYVPLLGLFLVWAKIIYDLRLPASFRPLAVLILLGLMGTSVWHTGHYRNPDTFFGRALALNSKDPLAYFNRGNARQRQKRDAEALSDYNAALQIEPTYAAALNNRGLLYSDKADHERAVNDYARAIESKPGFKNAYVNRALSLFLLGRLAEGCSDFRRAADLGDAKAPAIIEKYCGK